MLIWFLASGTGFLIDQSEAKRNRNMPELKASLKAVILVGGLGMRLRPLTDNIPKPMVPVLNKPAMEHTFAYLKQFGIEDIILAMNYLPDAFKVYFGDGSRCGVKLTYCIEKEPMGTAGAVKNVSEHLDGTFFVFNGDIFTTLNLKEMMASHQKNKAKATISLTWVDNPSAFGVVETDGSQKVKRFIEKPPLAKATTHWINAGTYILEPDVLKYVPVNTHYMFERGLFPGILEAGEPVYGFPYRGFWLDMGNPLTYFSLIMDILTLKVKSPLIAPLSQGKDGIRSGADVLIDSSAEISAPVIIDSGCQIGKGVKLKGPAVIGRDCKLDEDAVVENSILWDNINIGSNARIERCIVCSGANIKPNQEYNDCIITATNAVPLQKI
jgi:mannose-1-phosphate guanylyltransferase